MKPSDFVGNTPLVKITDKLYAKFEVYNPSGSIKDRMATYIINDAEKRGLLKPGDTIVEATSGNSGIAFALLAAERGYKIKIVMPCNMTEERKAMLRLFGADLIEVNEGDFEGAINLRNKLAEDHGWFNPNQFLNPLNMECHERTTAIEIIKQVKELGKELSAFAAGTGTGGTLMGTAKGLKKEFKSLKVIAVEPLESPVMSGGEPGVHGIQGIGDGSKFLVDLNTVDEVVTISTPDAKARAKKLISEMGMLVGISSGANVAASEAWIAKNKPQGIVVTILSDRGERYLSCL